MTWKTSALDALTFLLPGVVSLAFALKWPHPTLYTAAAVFTLIFLLLTYHRLKR